MRVECERFVVFCFGAALVITIAAGAPHASPPQGGNRECWP